MLSGWPAPAAIVSCYWSHLILGNTGIQAAYHRVLSSWHCCGPSPAAIVSCYWAKSLPGQPSLFISYRALRATAQIKPFLLMFAQLFGFQVILEV